jgi:excisionase family DNA binding protein
LPTRNGQTRYLITGEVARLLDVSPKTVARWAKEGKLPFKWTQPNGQGHRRYPADKIAEFVLGQQAGGRAEVET